MTSPHIFGLHWQREHSDDERDFAHIERMSYKAIKLFINEWQNGPLCATLLRICPPSTLFVLRDHALSEQKDDFARDPAGTGRRHAQEWAQKWADGRIKLPKERCVVEGINEPDSNSLFKEIDIYTLEFVVEAARYDIRHAGWCFGVGHPSTVDRDPAKPVDWSHYKASAAALSEHDGFANVHLYGAANDFSWKNHLGRLVTCPYALSAIVSEFGIDYGIIEGGNLQGWRSFMDADAYVKWLDEAQLGVRERHSGKPLQIHSLLPFTFDHAKPWGTFDIRWEVAERMESYAWSVPAPVQVTPAPPSPPLPISPPSSVLHMPFVSVPPHVPSAPEAERNWAASIDFVLGWEGGYVNRGKWVRLK